MLRNSKNKQLNPFCKKTRLEREEKEQSKFNSKTSEKYNFQRKLFKSFSNFRNAFLTKLPPPLSYLAEWWIKRLHPISNFEGNTLIRKTPKISAQQSQFEA